MVEGLKRHRVGPAGVPHLALNGDILAYATQADVEGQPEAELIHLLDLGSGTEIGSVPSPSVVWDMALSDSGLLFSSAHGQDDGQTVHSEVWFARADGQTFNLGPDEWEVAIDGERLVWVQSGPGVTGDPDVQGPAAMTATASDLQPQILSHPYTQPGCPPYCALVGSRWPAAGDGLASWEETDANGDYWLVVWNSASGAAIVLPFDGAEFVNSVGGGVLATATILHSEADEGQQLLAIDLNDIGMAMKP